MSWTRTFVVTRPPCLPANPSGCVLHRKSSAPQHSCQWTRCAMMATRIKWSATSAGERRLGQGLPEAAEEQNPELLWLKPRLHGDGHASERKSRHATLLGTKESLFSGSKSGPDIRNQEFVLHCVRGLLLPTLVCLCLGDGPSSGHSLVGLHEPNLPTLERRIPLPTNPLDNELQLQRAGRLFFCSTTL